MTLFEINQGNVENRTQWLKETLQTVTKNQSGVTPIAKAANLVLILKEKCALFA